MTDRGHVEFYSKNKFEKLGYLVGFIIRIGKQAFITVQNIKDIITEFGYMLPSPNTHTYLTKLHLHTTLKTLPVFQVGSFPEFSINLYITANNAISQKKIILADISRHKFPMPITSQLLRTIPLTVT